MEWNEMTRTELCAACEQRGISKQGSKVAMRERLEKYERVKDEAIQKALQHAKAAHLPQATQQPEVHPQPQVVQQPEAVPLKPIQPDAAGSSDRPKTIRSESVEPDATGHPGHPEFIRSEDAPSNSTTRQAEVPSQHGTAPSHDAPGKRELFRKSRYIDSYRPGRNENPRSQYLHPHPQNYPPQNAYRDIYHLTEAELEQRCRENFIAWKEDAFGERRRERVKIEFDTKTREFYKERDDAIAAVRFKYMDKVDILAKQRENKLAILDSEVSSFAAKERIWTPAWRRLKEINAARGTFVSSSKFNPDIQFRSVPEGRPTPPASKSSRAPSPAAASVRTGAATPFAKRRAIETDDDEDFTRQSSRRRKDDLATSSSLRKDPGRPDSNFQSIRAQLGYMPYVFLADSTILDSDSEEKALASLLAGQRFTAKRICSDERGFYWVFNDSRQGDRQAEDCYNHFQGQLFNGEKMRLELHPRVN